MSQRLPAVDLSTAAVGTTGTLDWSSAGLPTGQPGARGPRLQLFNESGCGLSITLSASGRTFSLPAGGWTQGGIDLLPIDRSLTYTVVYVIANAAVATLEAVYWPVGEVPPAVSLGNSPVGVSGSVTTTTVSSLKNDGNAPGTSIVESTPSDQASSSVALNNDASGFFKVLSAGVLRAILNVVRGNATSTKASITVGDSGDASILTVYGSIQGGQPANVGALTTGQISGTGAGFSSTINGTGAVFTSAITAAGIVISGRNGFGGASPAITFTSPNTEYWTPQTGAAQGHVFVVWNGTSTVIPFSVGLDLEGALSYVDATGHFFDNGNRVMPGQSAGGGAAGTKIWEGTVDPGASAAEGDLWIAG